MKPTPLKVAIVYYDHFAPLDVFGPMQAMNVCSIILPNDPTKTKQPLFTHVSVGKKIGIVTIGTGDDGPGLFCANSFETLPPVDVVLIPGGMGSRTLVNDDAFIGKLKTLVDKTPIVLSVCTGAGLLAKTGFLDGKKATSNKSAWAWVVDQGRNVLWECPPRWVGDVDPETRTGYMTSAGVAAGMDMMLALIDCLFGHDVVRDTQTTMEYTWNRDPATDPFAIHCPKCK